MIPRKRYGCTTLNCERGCNGEAMPREWSFCPSCGGELADIEEFARQLARRRRNRLLKEAS